MPKKISTMHSLCCVIVGAVLVALTTAQYDSEYCRKYLDRVDDSSATGIKPEFYDNFYLFMEIKDVYKSTTLYVDEYYSEQAEMVYGTVRGQVNQSQFWVDANTNEILSGPLTKSVCLDAPLADSTIAIALGATSDATGDVRLNTPEVALGWHKKYQTEVKYSGIDTTTARGIETVMWTVCSFNPETQITAVTDWYIVDPYKVVLPIVYDVHTLGNERPVLPVYAFSRGINKTNPQNVTEFAISVDFTFYDSITPNSPMFQIPTTMLCQTKPSAQVPLPNPPSYFRFRGEQIKIYDPTSENPTAPDLVYTDEEYMHDLNIFVQDFITKPSASDTFNDKSYKRTVNDYTTGISYNLDIETGECDTTIITEGVDSIAIAGGMVKMRNSQQFFDLDSNQYQYMGIHTMRGIICDSWSAYFNGSQSDHEADALYTWYFANTQWMNITGFSTTIQPLPISLEVVTGDAYVQFNFYEFDTQDKAITPDLTLCFNQNTTWNLRLNISAAFSQIQAVTLPSFRRAFYAAIMAHTSLNTVIRLSRINSICILDSSKFFLQNTPGAIQFGAGTIRILMYAYKNLKREDYEYLRTSVSEVQPITNAQTLVQFRLFDNSHLPPNDNVVNARPGVPNSQIWSELNNSISSGNFSIDVTTITDSGSTTVVSFLAQNLEICDGNNGACPPLTSGYSAGAMAGIAFGMLFLGTLLSVGAIFAFYRFRTAGGTSVIDKKKLDEESET